MRKVEKKANKVLKTTVTFIVRKGTEVEVWTDLGFDPFRALLPDDIRVDATDYFEITKCNCCSNLLLTYKDHLNRYHTVDLKDVVQVAESNSKEAA